MANWDALLQEDYVQQGIVEAINTSTPFQDTLKRVGMTAGRRRIYPIKVGASQGQGARAEGASQPGYGAGEYQDVIVTSKYNYAPCKLTGQAEEFSTKSAFVEFGLQLVKDTKEGLTLDTGRQCWGDGQGNLGLVNNGGGYAAGAQTVAVDSPFGVLWGSLSTYTTFLLKRKMAVQFGSEDNGGLGYEITGVSSTSITFTPPLRNAIADNATITRLGSANLEIEGILRYGATAAFQTATLGLGTSVYHGIDRTAFPEWEGNVLNVNAALALSHIRAARDLAYKRTDNESSNLLMGSTEFARDYEALLSPNVRFTSTSKDGGTSTLEHDGLRVSKDSKAPVRAFFLENTKTVAWAQTRDPHWLQDGSGIFRVVAGQDAKEGLLKWYANLDKSEPRTTVIAYNVTMS
jgi:hypothetical protein